MKNTGEPLKTSLTRAACLQVAQALPAPSQPRQDPRLRLRGSRSDLQFAAGGERAAGGTHSARWSPELPTKGRLACALLHAHLPGVFPALTWDTTDGP